MVQVSAPTKKMTLEAVVTGMPEVIGFAHPPAGRRRYWALIVPTCYWCRHLHQHRATGPDGGLRVGSCGRRYRVRVAGNKRRRWA